MLRSPLHDIHIGFGAKMVEFGGFDMPLRYTSITEEHNATRNGCTVFDVSHMGRVRVEGAKAEAFLQRICTRNMEGAADGQCRYSHICREDGGILDDVIVSKYSAERWLVVCNASNREKIVAWLQQHAGDFGVTIDDQTLATAMVAVQGPQTREILDAKVPINLDDIKRYRFVHGNVMGVEYAVFRSGYTGEDGYEVVVPAKFAPMLIPHLLGTPDQPHERIKPAGLGARDTLRLEAAMPLYGHELTEDIDSLSAGQGWCVDLSKDFIGADAMRKLKDSGLKLGLVGLEVDGRRIARQHMPVYQGDRRVGEVTSGTLSPTLNRNIAMASVDAGLTAEGTKLEIEIGGNRAAAVVVPLPFYKRGK